MQPHARHAPAKSAELWRRSVDPHRGWLVAAGPHTEKEAVELGNPERRPGAGKRRNSSKFLIAVTLPLEDAEHAFATTNIKAVTLRIEEDIVSVCQWRMKF